ncbi:MAG: hypothetical protein ACTSXH_08565 [Promethearchaeota archaeon]
MTRWILILSYFFEKYSTSRAILPHLHDKNVFPLFLRKGKKHEIKRRKYLIS